MLFVLHFQCQRKWLWHSLNWRHVPSTEQLQVVLVLVNPPSTNVYINFAGQFAFVFGANAFFIFLPLELLMCNYLFIFRVMTTKFLTEYIYLPNDREAVDISDRIWRAKGFPQVALN